MAERSKGKARSKGAGTITKEKNRFYFRKMINGHRATVLLRDQDGMPVTTRVEAEKVAERLNRDTVELNTREKLIERVGEIRHLKASSKFQLEDLWSLFLKSPNRSEAGAAQTKAQESTVKAFVDWLKRRGIEPRDITSDLAGEYMAELGQRIANRTFNGYLGMLTLVFGLIWKAAGMTSNPFAEIKRRRQEIESRREFTPEQVKAIFDGFTTGFYYETEVETMGEGRKRERKITTLEYKPMNHDELRVLLKLCCYTGCDGKSGCLMTWDGVDFNRNTICYVREKTRKKTGGRQISLPLHLELRAELLVAEKWRMNKNPYVLPKMADRYKRNPSGIQKDVMKIIHCATGLETKTAHAAGKRVLAANVYSLHSFRHTFVSFCANAGVPLAIVAEIVGHGSPAMTRHYSHISDEAKTKAIKALPAMNRDDMDAEALRLEIAKVVNSAEIEKLTRICDFIKAMP